MSRKDIYVSRKRDFMEDLERQNYPEKEFDPALQLYNSVFAVEMLCDLTDAICEIAKSLESMRAEVSQIRRQMPR